MAGDLPSDPLSTGIAHPFRTRGGFKTLQLNVRGWSALIGVGIAVGAVLAWSTVVPGLIALPIGMLGTWVLLVSLDHRRWRNSTVHLSHEGLDQVTGGAIVARLKEMGITATYREMIEEDEDGPFEQRGILCRQADAENVSMVLDNWPTK